MLGIPKKSFFGAALGTMIEYYDYALFSTFLPIIAPVIFPADTAYHALLKGYNLLLLTMLARPLGALCFGYWGDILSRRKALLLSMYGIALASMVIGLTPGYAAWGVWTIVLVITAKAMQAFCFGGEFNGAGIYVVEHARNNEGFISSLLAATTIFGSVLAALIGIVLTLHFMPAWSWRLAFILGGVFGAMGIIYRKNLTESPNFIAAHPAREGLQQLLKRYPRELLAGVFMGAFVTVPYTTVQTFISPVLMSKGYITAQQFMYLQAFINFIIVAMLIPIGILADKTSPAAVMKFACLALIILPYPLLLLVDSGNIVAVVVALIAIVSINEMFLGPVHAYAKNLFPMQFRYRGSSFGFCVGVSVFGGITPIVENYLYAMHGQFAAIAIWLGIIGVGAYTTMRWCERPVNLRMVEGVISSS